MQTAQPPFPGHLLLRDALYLLQGIDGRYVRFAFREKAQQNPYLTEKGKKGDGMGFPLGKEGEVPISDDDAEEEVVGLEFVADEQTVCHQLLSSEDQCLRLRTVAYQRQHVRSSPRYRRWVRCIAKSWLIPKRQNRRKA